MDVCDGRDEQRGDRPFLERTVCAVTASPHCNWLILLASCEMIYINEGEVMWAQWFTGIGFDWRLLDAQRL